MKRTPYLYRFKFRNEGVYSGKIKNFFGYLLRFNRVYGFWVFVGVKRWFARTLRFKDFQVVLVRPVRKKLAWVAIIGKQYN
tara:strand:- start:235 stop:477 length:243 start_codon:yes stop_codon:yes gene_type:complete